MTQITAADLDNAKLDVDTIADIANDTGVSVIDRLGATRLTANEAIRRMGYQVPVTYAASLVMSTLTQTVDYLGVVYAPLPTMIPFTTSGTFETTKFYVIQNNEIVKKYNTYADILASGGAILDNTRADTSGYHSSGDGGANSFYYSTASTATHNAGTVIKPTAVSGAGRWLATNPEITTLKQWGCVGDGTITDDSTKINDYLTYMAANGYKAAGVGTYRIDSKITIKGSCDFSEVTFNVYSTPAVAVEVSTGSAANPTDILFSAFVVLPVIINMTKPATGWAGQGVGVRVINAYSCEITANKISGFLTGLLCSSYGSVGNVYNTYNLGWLDNNSVNVALTPGATTSWVNENLYLNGRYSHQSAEGSGVAGTRHILMSKSTNFVNNNVFIKPSIEGDVCEYNVENGGAYNNIIGARWESTTPKVFYTSDNANQASRNIISGGYRAHSIVYTYTGSGGGNNQHNFAGGGSETVDTAKKIRNQAGNGSNALQIYESTVNPDTAGATEWSYGVSAQKITGKRSTDTYQRISLDISGGKAYFDNGTTSSPTRYIGAYGADNFAFYNDVFPGTDNAFSCGTAARRWSVVYAASATILTSDERSKQQITSDLSPELKAWAKVEFCKYKLNDAVEKKGKDGARWHFGVIAQQVKAAFESEGLDPFSYGILCYDEWRETEYEEMGERYGIRYEEALILECAYLRSIIK